MKAISLLQPWASLWCAGGKAGPVKVYETRSWATPHRGLLYVHASKGKDDAGRAVWRKLNTDPIWEYYLRERGLPLVFDALPFGALVGCVKLTGCWHTESLTVSKTEARLGDFSPGRFAWEAELFTRQYFAEAFVPCAGALGIWSIPPEIEARLPLVLA